MSVTKLSIGKKINAIRVSLSTRIVVATVGYSFFIALAVSAIQIYISYQQDIALAYERFVQIEKSYLPSIEADIWEVNTARVDALLDSIAQLPDVGKVVLTDENQQQFIRNNDSTNYFAEKNMLLHYSENNSTFDLGVLHVQLTNKAIVAKLKQQAIGVIIITLLTLSIGSICVFILFQRLVSRHLRTMANYAKNFDVNNLVAQLQFHRPENSEEDELDVVADAINRMQSTLKKELQLRAEIEQELREHKGSLEAAVSARTQELKSTIDQLDIAAEVAELGVWRWNLIDNSLQWNERMFMIYEQSKHLLQEGLKYQHWFERIHPDDVVETVASLMKAIEGTGEFKPMFRIVTPTGQIRIVQARAQVEKNEDGKVIKVTGINRDITAQMELEANLIDAKEKADAASADKSSFLANMSHEIRTPMNAVLGMLQLTLQTELSTRQHDYVSKAQTAAKSLLGLLNDILDFSKMDAGKLQLDNHPFEFEALMRDLAVILSGNQTDKNVEVIFDLDTRLPAAFLSDRLRLQQILINLAGNALKFTSEGHVLISVTVLAITTECATLRVAVSDTGIGISQEQQARIFDGFVQAEASTTRRFGGTGLGLAISKRLVSLFGGELHLDSEVGHGSRFWFDLELNIAPLCDMPEENVSTNISELNILVVDDNAISREVLMRTINAFGGHADAVNSGQAAIDAVEAADLEKAYDLVLMDFRMPQMDGLSAATKINKIPAKKLPAIIMITAFAREDIIEKQFLGKPPYVDFLTKPATPKQILNAIVNAVSGSSPTAAASPQTNILQLLEGVNLLVVEDNPVNRQVAFELLSSVGARVKLAAGGIEGVAMVLESQEIFDVIIMDVQMPDIDGMEATRRIRADHRFAQLPILAMTANASQDDRKECLAAGMTDHIGKPIDITVLVPCILRLLEKTASVLSIVTTVSESNQHELHKIVVEPIENVLKRFNNNVDFYARMLAEFPKNAAGYIETLKRMDNVSGAAKTLHAIKGLASTMGACYLASTASDLEGVCKLEYASEFNSVVTSKCLENIELIFSQSVTLLMNQLHAHKEKTQAINVPVASQSMVINWQKNMSEMLPLLQANNMEAISQIDILFSQIDPSLKARLQALKEQIYALDFNAATVTIKRLLSES